jgi:hypothetical protein
LVQLSRGSLVAAGSALALGAAQLPWLPARLALAGIGAWLAASGLGLAPATALFSAAGYLGSGALLVYGPRGDPASYASFAEIGTGIAALALLLAWRRASPPAPGPRWAGALGVLLALGACTFGARWLGVWLAAPVALFALAGLAADAGVLRGRNLVQALALFAAVLALRFPDRCGLAAAPAALGLALCAGDALEAAPRAARALGAAAFVLLAATSLYAGRSEPTAALPESLDEQDQWVRWRERPSRAGTLAWDVEVDARVPVAAVRLVFLSTGEEARRLEYPMEREALSGSARFAHAPVALAGLPEAAWSVRLELLGPQGQQTGERVIGALLLPRAPPFSPALLGFVLAALCLAFARAPAARVALAGCALVAAQACWIYVLS